MRTVRLSILCLLLLVTACNLPAASTPTSPSPINPPTTAPLPPEHRIGVRVVNGVGEFYDRVTGQKFVPRGNNYARLAPQTAPDGSTQVYHSVFDPGKYDSARAAAAFRQMHADGYNVVRVFVSQNTIGTADDGLSTSYMQNVADFLRLAKQNEIYVMFTQDWLPGGKYGAIMGQECCELFNFNNAQNLPGSAVRAYQAYYTDFITALLDLGAPTDYIFSYELRNEFFFDTNYPPLSLKSGKVTAANGKTYDMSSKADKQKMVEENLPYFIDNVRAAILKVDPTALVSIGFFVPQEPNPARIGDTRLVVTEPAIWNSQADFIDLHAYPGFELSLKQHVQNFAVNNMEEKPIIMGEFGGEVKRFASVDAAAQRFVNWQVESCKYGFDGWLFWTWDLDEQPDFFNAKMGGGAIERALAPATRPDPCAAGTSVETNLALGKGVTASRFLADQPPANAVDEVTETIWNAGAGPQQWIQINLGRPSTVTMIRLTISQYPDGATDHQLWVRGPNDSLKMIYEFRGNTTDNQTLEFKPASPLTNVQFIRILTVSSPSWVAWREIEVIGQ